MTTPTKAEIRRGHLNVRQLVLEAEAMLEHSPPRKVVAELLLAAAHIAHDAGMDANDFIRIFGDVLCSAMKRDLSILVEFPDGDGGSAPRAGSEE